ncbi:hypothetical protein F2P79_023045 [Pimephales promelas]|nr:hypothetical protein F2P79_023045 [Pimephales promelas]
MSENSAMQRRDRTDNLLCDVKKRLLFIMLTSEDEEQLETGLNNMRESNY